MALSPDGKWLAAGGWTDSECMGKCGGIRLYDFTTGKLVGLLEGHNNTVYRLAFSPDGKYLISGSFDRDAIIWDVAKKRLKNRLHGHTAEVGAVGFTPDSQRAVTGSYDKSLRLWSVADGSEIGQMTWPPSQSSRLSSSVPRAASFQGMTGEIRAWDSRTGALIGVLAKQESGVGSLSLSLDGKSLLAGIEAPYGPFPIQAYDAQTGNVRVVYEKHRNNVYATAISPDSRWAATGDPR